MGISLGSLDTTLSGTEMVARLQPSRQFANATFDSYIPDLNYPSQATTRDAVETMIRQISKGNLRKVAKKIGAQGIYLDGGFGVGKTHLLAAAWHLSAGPKAFGTFIEYTAIVGALGFHDAVELFRPYRLLCIDEFELDDPGDTLIMVRMLGELAQNGTSIVATSNTPPGALGEGRFAARDFFREIQAIGSLFTSYQLDGEDYRRRALADHIPQHSAQHQQLVAAAVSADGGLVAEDSFADVLSVLRLQHPARYARLAEQISAVWWHDISVLDDQNDALRLVAFIDRLYDTQVAIISDGESLERIFPAPMLNGGYEKKYRRALSRLAALDASAESAVALA